VLANLIVNLVTTERVFRFGSLFAHVYTNHVPCVQKEYPSERRLGTSEVTYTSPLRVNWDVHRWLHNNPFGCLPFAVLLRRLPAENGEEADREVEMAVIRKFVSDEKNVSRPYQPGVEYRRAKGLFIREEYEILSKLGMSKAERDDFDELLIAEGVVSEEELRDAQEWVEEADVDELIDSAELIEDEGLYDPTEEFTT
jgi:hypothetical protein